jgi:hypothetical protein
MLYRVSECATLRLRSLQIGVGGRAAALYTLFSFFAFDRSAGDKEPVKNRVISLTAINYRFHGGLLG